MSTDERMKRLRAFLKDSARKQFDFSTTDQNQGVPPPPIQKPLPKDARPIDLPLPGRWSGVEGIDLQRAMGNRRSRRQYKEMALSMDELSFLLWAVQGLREAHTPARAFRTVPSAGCRHALETYLAVFRVGGLAVGVYRYLPLTHQMVLEFADEGLSQKLAEATLGQSFAGQAAVTFIWTAVPYRMEWRYGEVSHKVIALDAGHACQNLYLACEAIHAGTCAIAAYDQERLDELLRVDGQEEFAIYLAPVGRI